MQNLWMQSNMDEIRTMKGNELRQQWNEACLQVGLPAISLDTTCRILAIVYVHGGSHENFTYSTGLRADLEYICKKYNIHGGGIVPTEIAKLVRKYVCELEDGEKKSSRKGNCSQLDLQPTWVNELLNERYGFTI